MMVVNFDILFRLVHNYIKKKFYYFNSFFSIFVDIYTVLQLRIINLIVNIH